jgi:uncharacterized membrane protein YkvA (DUF1232 family)
VRWWQWLLVGAAVLVTSWVVLVLLARRLPPGLARDLASVLPACVTTVRRLWRDPRVPRRARVVVAFAGLWVISPIDLIPEFLPVIGPLDDVVIVALALRYAARHIPREAVAEAWPGDPALLDRLLGQPGTRRRWGRQQRVSDPRSIADTYFAAVTAHDPDAVQACFADDAELVSGTMHLRGREAIGDFYRQNLTIEDLRPAPGRYVIDDDRLAVEIDLFVVGQHNYLADFFTFRDGKIQRLVIYGLAIPQ